MNKTLLQSLAAAGRTGITYNAGSTIYAEALKEIKRLRQMGNNIKETIINDKHSLNAGKRVNYRLDGD